MSLVVFLSLVGCGSTQQSAVKTAPSPTPSPDVTYRVDPIGGRRVTYDDAVWPVNGMTVDMCFCYRPAGSAFHDGVNIPGNTDDPVYSIADGTVVKVQTVAEAPQDAYGNVVAVQHTMDTPLIVNGQSYTTYYSVYGHLNSIQTRVGAVVRKGDRIAGVGATGQASEENNGQPYTHLHFGSELVPDVSNANRNKAYVNPYLFLPYNDRDSLTAEVISLNPLTVRVREQRDEMDFNRITVMFGGVTKTIDYDEKTGIDVNNQSALTLSGVTVTPSVGGSGYFLAQTFAFSDLKDFTSIEVTDVWGKGIRITK